MLQIERGEVGMDEAMLLMKDPDKLAEAVQDALARNRDQKSGVRSQPAAYLEDEENWD